MMDNRDQARAQDDELDARIEQLLRGKSDAAEDKAAEERVAREFARLAAEESPRLSTAARTQGLNALRAQTPGAASQPARILGARAALGTDGRGRHRRRRHRERCDFGGGRQLARFTLVPVQAHHRRRTALFAKHKRTARETVDESGEYALG